MNPKISGEWGQSHLRNELTAKNHFCTPPHHHTYLFWPEPLVGFQIQGTKNLDCLFKLAVRFPDKSSFEEPSLLFLFCPLSLCIALVLHSFGVTLPYFCDEVLCGPFSWQIFVTNFCGELFWQIFVMYFLLRIFVTNFFEDFFWQSYPLNLLTIASFRIGVHSILFLFFSLSWTQKSQGSGGKAIPAPLQRRYW